MARPPAPDLRRGLVTVLSGLTRAAEAGLLTTVRAASANRACLEEMAREMFEDEEDGDWIALKKSERRVWLNRATSALQGFAKFLAGKPPE